MHRANGRFECECEFLVIPSARSVCAWLYVSSFAVEPDLLPLILSYEKELIEPVEGAVGYEHGECAAVSLAISPD